MNKFFYIANWKMNIKIQESEVFLKDFLSVYKKSIHKEVVLCPSFTTLSYLINNYGNIDAAHWGAQNVSDVESGAHTGEISVSMLEELKIRYCIVGHSERRQIYNEKNATINKKIQILNDCKITPILCVGETIEDRENGKSEAIVVDQLSRCLEKNKSSKIIIAYEPIWAIGSGANATIDDISEMNKTIKNHMNNLGYVDDQFYILYGGSVSIDNLLTIKGASFLNGFLIGGASLSPKTFWEIIDK